MYNVLSYFLSVFDWTDLQSFTILPECMNQHFIQKTMANSEENIQNHS